MIDQDNPIPLWQRCVSFITAATLFIETTPSPVLAMERGLSPESVSAASVNLFTRNENMSGWEQASLTENKEEKGFEERPERDAGLRMVASSDVLLLTEAGEGFYEYWMSGGGHNCALYALGFKNRPDALTFLKSLTGRPEILSLVVPEIRAELAAGEAGGNAGRFSRFIADSSDYKKLREREEKAKIALNRETQRLSRLGGSETTLTQEQLEKQFKAEDLVAYHALVAVKLQLDRELTTYLSQEEIFAGFITRALGNIEMLTYLPGDAGATGIIDALAHGLNHSLIIYGKNHDNRLAPVHSYIWDAAKPIKKLLHTRCKDETGRAILGGVPGTIINNSWNHFNLLDSQKNTLRRWVEVLGPRIDQARAREAYQHGNAPMVRNQLPRGTDESEVKVHVDTRPLTFREEDQKTTAPQSPLLEALAADEADLVARIIHATSAKKDWVEEARAEIKYYLGDCQPQDKV